MDARFCPVCHRPVLACRGDPQCRDPYQRTDWAGVIMFVVAHLPLALIALLVLNWLSGRGVP